MIYYYNPSTMQRKWGWSRNMQLRRIKDILLKLLQNS